MFDMEDVLRSILLPALLAGLFTVALNLPTNGQVVYTNGPTNGTINAWGIGGGATSDAFTVSTESTLTSVTAGLWVPTPNVPATVGWEIGTVAFGSDVSSGTATPTNVFDFTNSIGFNVFDSSFAVTGALAPGDYWLTLTNTFDNNGDGAGWDENDGPSNAFQGDAGEVGSEAFTIFGTSDAASSTPEPGTLALCIGMGLAGFAARRHRLKPANS